MKLCHILLYAIQGVKNIINKVTSWPQLISRFLVAPSYLFAMLASHFFMFKVLLTGISLLLATIHGILINNLATYIPSHSVTYSCRENGFS